MNKLKKFIKRSVISVFALAIITAVFALCAPNIDIVSAACDPASKTLEGGLNCAQGNIVKTTLFGTGGQFTVIINTILFIIGAISVVMLIYGGVRYTISGGDSGAVTNAKNTILYAIVGVIISVLAFAIVNFVIGALA